MFFLRFLCCPQFPYAGSAGITEFFVPPDPERPASPFHGKINIRPPTVNTEVMIQVTFSGQVKKKRQPKHFYSAAKALSVLRHSLKSYISRIEHIEVQLCVKMSDSRFLEVTPTSALGSSYGKNRD